MRKGFEIISLKSRLEVDKKIIKAYYRKAWVNQLEEILIEARFIDTRRKHYKLGL